MANSKQPVEADQFLQVIGRIADDAAAASASIRASGNHDLHSAAIFECLASNRHARPAADSALLSEIESYLRDGAIDRETLIRYAAQGFLARAAVVDITERTFGMQRQLVEGLARRQQRVRTERARKNGEGNDRQFTDAKLLAHRADFVAAHRGSDFGWRAAAAIDFGTSDTYISRRYKKISELT